MSSQGIVLNVSYREYFVFYDSRDKELKMNRIVRDDKEGMLPSRWSKNCVIIDVPTDIEETVINTCNRVIV